MQFLLPDLGEGIQEAQVLRLLVAEGDVVAADQPLMEVETDKAAVEIPSPVAGKVVKIHADQGQVVNVGKPLITFETAAGDSATTETPKTATAAAPTGAADDHDTTTAAAPTGAADDHDTRVTPGTSSEQVAPGTLATPDTPAEQATLATPATPDTPDTPARQDTPATQTTQATPVPAPTAPGTGRAAPVVRRLARKLGVDLAQVQATGPRGRILREDVRRAAGTGTASAVPAGEAPATAALATAPSHLSPPAASHTQATPLAPATWSAPPRPAGAPGHDAHGPIRRQTLTQVRKTIAARMVQSATEIPHVTNFEDADVTDLDRLRRQYNEAHPPEQKRTLMSYVILAVTRSLARFPVFNAEFDAARQEIVYKDYVNIGVAVDSARGLVVPVMRGVEQMDLTRIAAELKVLATRVKTVSFEVEDLRGSSFTVSNAGTSGGNRYATPILNYPETALLSLGRARLEPRYVEGELRPRLILPLSHTFDHRAADGGDSARFLGDVIDQLEHPGRLWI